MDAITKFTDTFGKRLDKLEGKKAADEDHPVPPTDKKAADDDNKNLAADADKNHIARVLKSLEVTDECLKYQARADQVYTMWGKDAPKPPAGVGVLNYRRMLLEPMKQYSDVWKHSDLRVLAVDESTRRLPRQSETPPPFRWVRCERWSRLGTGIPTLSS